MTWVWPEIPEPSWGYYETPGAPTQDRLASQTGNIALPAGTVMRLLPGQHHISGRLWTCNGTQSQPVFIVAEPGATVVDNGELRIAGQYVMLYGLTFLGGARIRNQAAWAAYRGLEITGLPVSGSSPVMISCEAGHDVVVAGCHIHHNSAQPADVHACKSSAPGFERLWFLENNCHHNGGDSIQMGSAVLSEPWPRFTYIAGNLMHEEGENGIDLKKCRDTIAADNDIWGMVSTPGNDPGRGVVLHDSCDAATIRRNRIRDCMGEGIVSTGATNLLFQDNEVRRCNYGVRAYGSSGEAFGNKAWDCATPYQFNVPSGTVNAHDNLIDPPEGQAPSAPSLSLVLEVA